MDIVFGVLSLLLSVSALYGAVYWVRLRARVSGWPTVRGTVLSREAIQPKDRARGSTPFWRWAPEVRFSYHVGEADYQGDKTTLPWSGTTSKERVEAFLSRIPDEVDVRYDPADPKTSCLFPPSRWNVVAYGLAGCGGLLFAAMWLLPALV